MSYSTNPVLDYTRYAGRVQTLTDSLQASERMLTAEFMAAAQAGRMDAVALFAPSTTDFLAPKKDDGSRPLRATLVGEVLEDSLGYGNGPRMADVMGLLCKVAKGEAQAEAARALLERMAGAYAQQNAEASE